MGQRDVTTRLAVAGALALGATGIATGVGYAVPPLDVVAPVVDDAGVLSPAEESRIEVEIHQLAAERDVELHVVFVRSFDGLSGPDWTEQTFDRAGLGEGDVLVAVAVDERRYGYVEETDAHGGEADDAATDHIEPALRDGDWDGAALGAVEGYRAALAPMNWWIFGGSGAAVLGVIGAVASALFGPAILRGRRRRAERAQEVVRERLEIVDLLTGTRALADRAEQEQDYVGTQLGEDESERLARARRTGEAELDEGVLLLAEVPGELPRRPSHQQLNGWTQTLEQAAARLKSAHEALSAAVTRVDVGRALLRDPSRAEDLRATVEAGQDRVVRLRSQGVEGSPWLQKHVSGLLDHAGTALSVAATAAAACLTSIQDGRGGDAAEELVRGEEARATGDALLDRAGDPQEELRAALAELAPQESRLRAILAEAEGHRARSSDYAQQAQRIGQGGFWGTVDTDRLPRAIELAGVVLAASGDDPEARGRDLEVATQAVDSAVSPYATLARMISEARSSGGSGSGSRRRSSSRRRSGSRSRSRSRSRSSSRSRGGGRF